MFRLFLCIIKVDILFCIDIWIKITKIFASFYCDTQCNIKINEKTINQSFIYISDFIFSTTESKRQKSYFIIDDLIHMSREKFKSIDLSQHQKRRFFSHSIDARSFVTYQFRIIVYFLFAVNQKASISQNLKSQKSKSFQQFTFAKTIRSVLSKKSIYSSYKLADIFYVNSEIFANSNSSEMKSPKSHMLARVLRVNFVLFRLFLIFLVVVAFVLISSTSVIIYIDIYEWFIKIIHFVNQWEC